MGVDECGVVFEADVMDLVHGTTRAVVGGTNLVRLNLNSLLFHTELVGNRHNDKTDKVHNCVHFISFFLSVDSPKIYVLRYELEKGLRAAYHDHHHHHHRHHHHYHHHHSHHHVYQRTNGASVH